MVFAPIVIGQFGDPFQGHRARQEPRGHRGINDYADLFQMAEAQNLPLDLAADQRIWGLQRCNRRDALRQLHLFDIEVGDTDPADLSLLLELRHGRPAFFEFRSVIHGPMDLVEVNGINAQPAQAVFTLAANGISLQYVMDFPLSIPTQTTFGEDIRARTAPARQRARDDFFRVAGAMDRRDGRVVILSAPSELPARAADGPGAEAHGRDE